MNIKELEILLTKEPTPICPFCNTHTTVYEDSIATGINSPNWVIDYEYMGKMIYRCINCPGMRLMNPI